MRKRTFVEIGSILFVILFLYTGISKLLEHSILKEQLSATRFIGPFAGSVSIGLPILEMITAILIFLPKFRLLGLVSGIVLMIIFSGYVLVILNTDENLPCTCGGILQALSWKQHLIFNLCFVAIGLLTLRFQLLITPFRFGRIIS